MDRRLPGFFFLWLRHTPNKTKKGVRDLKVFVWKLRGFLRNPPPYDSVSAFKGSKPAC